MKLKRILRTMGMPITARSCARHRRRGQALVEMALLGLILAVLLAGAIDFGRAYYTAVVVTNMAGEGASYAAIYPERDLRLTHRSCSRVSFPDTNTIQNRVRRVAKDRGLIIDVEDLTAAAITVTPDRCQDRCAGTTVTVRVNYRLNDLFLPNLLGFPEIPITRSASQVIQTDPPQNGSCP